MIGEPFDLADLRLDPIASSAGLLKLSSQRMRISVGLLVNSLIPVPLPGLHLEKSERLRMLGMSRTRTSNL